MEDRLQKFSRVVEAGSFTAAAEDMHISQPALTLAVNKLERELRTSLLVRNRKHLELTEAGRIAYAAANEYRTTSQNLRTRLAELAHERPKVAIGMIDSVAAVLNGNNGPLDQLEIQADVSITVNNSRYLRSAVKNGEIDLAIAVQNATSNQGLDTEPGGTELFVIVCRPDMFQTAQQELNTGILPDFISYDRYSTTYGHLHAGLYGAGITTRPILYSTNPEIMLRTVLRGKGTAALPYLLARELVNTGRLVILQKEKHILTIACPLSVWVRHGKVLPKALETFSKQAKSTIDLMNRNLIPSTA